MKSLRIFRYIIAGLVLTFAAMSLGNLSFAQQATSYVRPHSSAEPLAKFRLSQSIEGMRVPGQPPGAGDMKLEYILWFDATNPQFALELWYAKLGLFFGDGGVEKLRNEANRIMQQQAQ